MYINSCYYLLNFQPPFTSTSRKKTIEKILRGKLIFPPYLTTVAQDFIRKLLRVSVYKLITVNIHILKVLLFKKNFVIFMRNI